MYKLILNDTNYISEYGEISKGYFELNKSKFSCYIFNIDSVKQANEYLNIIKKDNKKARHVVYAYKFGSLMKYCNDNEPKGSGVNSVINILERDNVTNYLVVIVRYFGGTLLGSSRLYRSYLNSFKEAYKVLDKE